MLQLWYVQILYLSTCRISVVDLAWEIRNIISDESHLDHSKFDAFILFIMSHGKDGCIYGLDDNPVDIVNDIAGVLGSCSTLMGKPKLIFFQACRST